MYWLKLAITGNTMYLASGPYPYNAREKLPKVVTLASQNFSQHASVRKFLFLVVSVILVMFYRLHNSSSEVKKKLLLV